MRSKSFHIQKKPRKMDFSKSAEEMLKEILKPSRKGSDYRERSLEIHGLLCAKCGREFDHKTSHLLTVHHKDGNHLNNPPDGSNWENLCVYCHDEEHGREYSDDEGRTKK